MKKTKKTRKMFIEIKGRTMCEEGGHLYEDLNIA